MTTDMPGQPPTDGLPVTEPNNHLNGQAATDGIAPPGGPDGEQVLYSARTHPKVLFKPAVVQLAVWTAHVLVAMWWPDSLGAAGDIDVIDTYGQLAVHGLLLAVAGWYAIIPVLRWWTSVFTVTDWRVTKQWGVLYKHSREIPLNRIVSVGVERGVVDRLFGCGTLALHDPAAAAQVETSGVWNQGPTGPGVRFKDVPRVQMVHQLVNTARRQATR